MSSYTVIADASSALLRLLRQQVSPDPVQSPEMIALASPSDKNGDFQLGVFLYDIRPLSEYRTSAQVRRPGNTRTYPDRPLTLHYMLFVNSRAQIAAGAETEQRILGRAIQALMDSPQLDFSLAQLYQQSGEDTASIALVDPSFEEKNRIWSSLNLPYQVGVYFTVSPVNVSSRHSETFTRVVDTQFTTQPIKRD